MRRKRRLYIVAPGKYGVQQAAKLFMGRLNPEWIGVRSISDADVVLFTGGPDINPTLYGENRLDTTKFNDERDELDLQAWGQTLPHQVVVGICRGAQLLNVMCGGSLWQHVDGHHTPHYITDRMTGNRIWATSTHHQAMIPGQDAEVVATSSNCTVKLAHGAEWERRDRFKNPNVVFEDGDHIDYEVLRYPDRNVMCFQPHPEHVGAQPGLRTYFFNQLEITCLRAEKKATENAA